MWFPTNKGEFSETEFSGESVCGKPHSFVMSVTPPSQELRCGKGIHGPKRERNDEKGLMHTLLLTKCYIFCEFGWLRWDHRLVTDEAASWSGLALFGVGFGPRHTKQIGKKFPRLSCQGFWLRIWNILSMINVALQLEPHHQVCSCLTCVGYEVPKEEEWRPLS